MKTFGILAAISVIWISITTSGAQAKPVYTFKDLSFNTSLKIQNRTVSCLGKPMGNVYLSQMYTCVNITIDGERLFHGFNYIVPTQKNMNDYTKHPCGTYESQPNDLLALCRAMLQEQQAKYTNVISAFVLHPFCQDSRPEPRFKYLVDSTSGKARWSKDYFVNGYVGTLQCLTHGNN